MNKRRKELNAVSQYFLRNPAYYRVAYAQPYGQSLLVHLIHAESTTNANRMPRDQAESIAFYLEQVGVSPDENLSLYQGMIMDCFNNLAESVEIQIEPKSAFPQQGGDISCYAKTPYSYANGQTIVDRLLGCFDNNGVFVQGELYRLAAIGAFGGEGVDLLATPYMLAKMIDGTKEKYQMYYSSKGMSDVDIDNLLSDDYVRMLFAGEYIGKECKINAYQQLVIVYKGDCSREHEKALDATIPVNVNNTPRSMPTAATSISTTDNWQRCKRCGCQLKKGAAFCTNCGEKVIVTTPIAPHFCGNCGTKLSVGMAFCPQCGWKIR